MKDLILRSLKGDSEAYTCLIEQIQDELYRIALSKLDNIDDINDAIQETIIHSYNKLYTLKNYDYFKTWIIRILINECHTIYRKNIKQKKLLNKIENSNNNYINFQNDFANRENDIDFNLLLKSLKPDDRLILTLYYKNNYSTTEIANILNKNVNTIKSKIVRAKSKLKQLYDEGGRNYEINK